MCVCVIIGILVGKLKLITQLFTDCSHFNGQNTLKHIGEGCASFIGDLWGKEVLKDTKIFNFELDNQWLLIMKA
jgi:hypothetical protein